MLNCGSGGFLIYVGWIILWLAFWVEWGRVLGGPGLRGGGEAGERGLAGIELDFRLLDEILQDIFIQPNWQSLYFVFPVTPAHSHLLFTR